MRLGGVPKSAWATRPSVSRQRAVVAPVSAVALSPETPSTSASTSGAPKSAAEAKQQLLEAIKNTQRGLGVRRMQRGLIEDAQVALEAFTGDALDYKLLAGKWKLVYTTASDVLPILEIESRLSGPFGSPLQVGDIYQRFSTPEAGTIENIIQFSAPLLEERKGVTFRVVARYEVRSGKRIALTFEEAQVGDVRISETLETLLAPALLPRGSLNHLLLLALKQFQLRIPFRTAQQVANMAVARSNIAANYLLTYLDEDMLIGRAVFAGGTFIFTREEEEPYEMVRATASA